MWQRWVAGVAAKRVAKFALVGLCGAGGLWEGAAKELAEHVAEVGGRCECTLGACTWGLPEAEGVHAPRGMHQGAGKPCGGGGLRGGPAWGDCQEPGAG